MTDTRSSSAAQAITSDAPQDQDIGHGKTLQDLLRPLTVVLQAYSAFAKGLVSTDDRQQRQQLVYRCGERRSRGR